MSANRQVRISRIVAVVFFVSLAAAHAAAQSRLAATTSLDCSFTAIASGTWTDGAAEGSLDAATLTMRFEAIDTDSATAEVVGPYGASSIIVRQTGDYLHLVQMFMVGPLYTTTVIDRDTTDGKLMAVHTRHEYTDTSLPGFTSMPEQYYGECVIGT